MENLLTILMNEATFFMSKSYFLTISLFFFFYKKNKMIKFFLTPPIILTIGGLIMETQATNLNPSVMSLEEVKGVLYLTVRGKLHESSSNSQTAQATQPAATDHLVDTTA